jgi:hypothetical protein
MEQSQIDEMKAIRKKSTKRIKAKVSKIIAIQCDCSDVQLSDGDLTAIDEIRQKIKAKKIKYANPQ